MDTETALRDLRQYVKENGDALERSRTVDEPEEINMDLTHVPLERAVYTDNMRLNRLYASSRYQNAKLEAEIDETERKYDQIRAELNNAQIDVDDLKCELEKTKKNMLWYKKRLYFVTGILIALIPKFMI